MPSLLGFLVFVEGKPSFAQQNLVTVAEQHRLSNLHAVELRAICAVEIQQQVTGFSAQNARVRARNGPVRQAHFPGGLAAGPANGGLLAPQRVPLAPIWPGAYQQKRTAEGIRAVWGNRLWTMCLHEK